MLAALPHAAQSCRRKNCPMSCVQHHLWYLSHNIALVRWSAFVAVTLTQ